MRFVHGYLLFSTKPLESISDLTLTVNTDIDQRHIKILRIIATLLCLLLQCECQTDLHVKMELFKVMALTLERLTFTSLKCICIHISLQMLHISIEQKNCVKFGSMLK